ncbi:MAG TPA: aldose 1-epimerase [Pseudomonas sp.]|nr:aldose 1-epimerase [Pseudomonas sp.]
MTATLLLEDPLTRLTLLPELGGSLVNWSLRSNGLPLLRHADQLALDAGTPRRLGCFPLIPWSNRIGAGGFANPAGWLDLPRNSDDPLPIHGSAWQQPWQVLEHSTRHALLRLDSSQPFAYRAEQRIELDNGCLSLRLTVTHLAEQPAWHGLGLHPYFPRTANTQLQATADSVWLCDAQQLSSERVERPAAWRFEQLARLPEERVDNAFTGWDGRCRILQPDLGYALDCSASHCDYFLLFTPPGQGFFCFEPVSHPVNAHHLPGQPGLRLLQRGQSLQLGWSMAYRPLA